MWTDLLFLFICELLFLLLLFFLTLLALALALAFALASLLLPAIDVLFDLTVEVARIPGRNLLCCSEVSPGGPRRVRSGESKAIQDKTAAIHFAIPMFINLSTLIAQMFIRGTSPPSVTFGYTEWIFCHAAPASVFGSEQCLGLPSSSIRSSQSVVSSARHSAALRVVAHILIRFGQARKD